MTHRPPFRLSPEADTDYLEILNQTFITRGIDQLLKYESELNHALETISLNPEIGSPRDELVVGVRAFALLPSVIYYTASVEETLVIRILHHRRNARSILKGRPRRDR
ncbi:MAG: type II toxin-antitoxin system RelE/ParE family toxin [Thermomicrobiales bacterium]